MRVPFKIIMWVWANLASAQLVLGQVNLVCNPAFEDTIVFQSEFRLLELMIPPWSTWQSSPDYFSKLYSASKSYSVDSVAGIGSLIPRSGHGFIGALMANSYTGDFEYFSGKLTSPLRPAKRYCVNYFIKRGILVYGTENWASDGFGIYFAKDSLVNDTCCLPPYTPQIKNPHGNVIYDTSWIAMSGSFIAEGGERYFIVGNFKDADQTTFDPPSPYASTYYFFDDFSVWYCDSTTITEVEIDPLLPHQHLPPDTVDGNPQLPLIIPNLLSVYGNSTWQIGNLQFNTEITLYNALGQLVYHTVNYANNLNAAELAAGMYIYRISRADKEDVIGKLVIVR